MLTVAVGYGYNKYSAEVEILKANNKYLVETKGCCEAHQMFVAEKEEAVKLSSETHVANTDRLMNMFKSARTQWMIAEGTLSGRRNSAPSN